MWCDLHDYNNELVMVYDYVRIKNNRKVLSIESIGIVGAEKFVNPRYLGIGQGIEKITSR